MKSVVRSVGAAAILLFAGVPQVHAQVTGPITFTTTFPFAVGHATVPAGSYTIAPDDDAPGVFQLTGAHIGVLFLATEAEARQTPAKTEIVFMRYGEEYVLKDIFVEGSATGAESIVGEAERHASKRGESKSEHRVSALRANPSKDR